MKACDNCARTSADFLKSVKEKRLTVEQMDKKFFVQTKEKLTLCPTCWKVHDIRRRAKRQKQG